jgi:mannosyl-oligosaccharide glucosidase
MSVVALFLLSLSITCQFSSAHRGVTQLSKPHQDDRTAMLWGPFRPNLYFGLRARTPDSPLIGLMWGEKNGQHLTEYGLRHTCEQADDMASYGWRFYDPRVGGFQEVLDSKHSLNMSMTFHRPASCAARGCWTAKVVAGPTAVSLTGSETMVVLYVGAGESKNDQLRPLTCTNSTAGMQCNGFMEQFGHYTLSVELEDSSQSVSHTGTKVFSVRTRAQDIWQAKGTHIKVTHSTYKIYLLLYG